MRRFNTEGPVRPDRHYGIPPLARLDDVNRVLEHYARLFGHGKLTLARAAREAGVTLWEMMDFTRSNKIAVQYGLEDLRQDMDVIRSRLDP